LGGAQRKNNCQAKHGLCLPALAGVDKKRRFLIE
jgi:hypothetical protein